MKKYIIKYSKEKNKFSQKKLKKSLRKAGASTRLANTIVHNIEKEPAITDTKSIHDYTFKYLKKENRPIAARYNLKRAISELGPTGFPFEKFVAELLFHQGYAVKINQILNGECIKHEVDVIAEKTNEYNIVECKFHHRHWAKSHIQTALYMKARFNDIEKNLVKQQKNKQKKYSVWIVTNTKFTADCIQYAKCAEIKLISWSQPINNSLVNIVEDLGAYPITTLTSLRNMEKGKLIKNGIVLCKDLESNSNILVKLKLKQTRIKAILEEARAICNL